VVAKSYSLIIYCSAYQGVNKEKQQQDANQEWKNIKRNPDAYQAKPFELQDK